MSSLCEAASWSFVLHLREEGPEIRRLAGSSLLDDRPDLPFVQPHADAVADSNLVGPEDRRPRRRLSRRSRNRAPAPRAGSRDGAFPPRTPGVRGRRRPRARSAPRARAGGRRGNPACEGARRRAAKARSTERGSREALGLPRRAALERRDQSGPALGDRFPLLAQTPPERQEALRARQPAEVPLPRRERSGHRPADRAVPALATRLRTSSFAATTCSAAAEGVGARRSATKSRDRPVGLVADGGDGRDGRRRERPRDTLVVEGREVFGRATASRDDQDVESAPAVAARGSLRRSPPRRRRPARAPGRS